SKAHPNSHLRPWGWLRPPQGPFRFPPEIPTKFRDCPCERPPANVPFICTANVSHICKLREPCRRASRGRRVEADGQHDLEHPQGTQGRDGRGEGRSRLVACGSRSVSAEADSTQV